MKNKKGPEREPNSLNTLGHTMIHVDVPTRDNFKEVARKEGKSLNRYLQELAKRERDNKQGALLPAPYIATVKEKEASGLERLLTRFAEYTSVTGARGFSAIDKAMTAHREEVIHQLEMEMSPTNADLNRALNTWAGIFRAIAIKLRLVRI